MSCLICFTRFKFISKTVVTIHMLTLNTFSETYRCWIDMTCIVSKLDLAKSCFTNIKEHDFTCHFIKHGLRRLIWPINIIMTIFSPKVNLITLFKKLFSCENVCWMTNRFKVLIVSSIPNNFWMLGISLLPRSSINVETLFEALEFSSHCRINFFSVSFNS